LNLQSKENGSDNPGLHRGVSTEGLVVVLMVGSGPGGTVRAEVARTGTAGVHVRISVLHQEKIGLLGVATLDPTMTIGEEEQLKYPPSATRIMATGARRPQGLGMTIGGRHRQGLGTTIGARRPQGLGMTIGARHWQGLGMTIGARHRQGLGMTIGARVSPAQRIVLLALISGVWGAVHLMQAALAWKASLHRWPEAGH